MRSLFLFAHPDDEFGCYESIRREALSGQEIVCCYLTDGGFEGQSVERRETESLHVLTRLGVCRENVKFIGRRVGIPDGSLPCNMLRAAEAVKASVGPGDDVDVVFTPAWEGGHQDHDAANILACVVSGALRPKRGLWQFSLYNGAGLRGYLFRVLTPLPSNGPVDTQALSISLRMKYLRFCFAYPSQWKTWLGLLPFVAVRLVLGGCYFLQRAALPPVVRRPHGGPLLYERRGMDKFDRVERYITEFIKQSANCL